MRGLPITVAASFASKERPDARDQGTCLVVVASGPSTIPLPTGVKGAGDEAVGGEQVDWGLLVPRLVNPTKVIILESMQWIGRPLSATELEKISGGEPILNSFSYHLKNLARLGVLEVVEKRKARKSRSPKEETFFYFARRH